MEGKSKGGARLPEGAGSGHVRSVLRDRDRLAAHEGRPVLRLFQIGVEHFQMELAYVLVHHVRVQLSRHELQVHHVLHVGEPKMLHVFEDGAVDRPGVVHERPGLRLDVSLAADLQKGLFEHLARGVAEQSAVQIDAADEIRMIQAQHVGHGPAQGMAGGPYAGAPVDTVAEGLLGVFNGVQGVLLPFGHPAQDELAVSLLQRVELLGQLPVGALGMGQLQGLQHAAPQGIVLLLGKLSVEKDAGAVVQLRAAGVVGMAHGQDQVALGDQLQAQEGIALPVGGQTVVEHHQREPTALYPGRVRVALGQVVPGRLPLVVGDGYVDGLLKALCHVSGHVAGLVQAGDGFLAGRVVDPDRDAPPGAGGAKLLPVGIDRVCGGADGIWAGGQGPLVHAFSPLERKWR